MHLHRDRSLKSLPEADIRAILRAADPLIGHGGRTLLVKILKGSRSKDVLKLGLERNPAYGYYGAMAADDVLARVDWMILKDYLRIDYAGKLPMLVFSPTGWEIERETYANELIDGFDQLLAAGQRPFDMLYLKDKNRGLILLVLDKIRSSGDPKYLPLLEDWQQIDYRKVKQEISHVVAHLTGSTPAATAPPSGPLP